MQHHHLAWCHLAHTPGDLRRYGAHLRVRLYFSRYHTFQQHGDQTSVFPRSFIALATTGTITIPVQLTHIRVSISLAVGMEPL